MKTVFIETRYRGKADFSGIDAAKLPKKIAVFTTTQYLGFIPGLVSYLEAKGKKVILKKLKHAKYPGQILGCSIESLPSADGFLYFGDGMFHPLTLAIKNGRQKPVFAFDPHACTFLRIPENELGRFEKTRKSAVMKFYSSDNIGILISTKPGQLNHSQARLVKNKYPEKRFYMLLFDTLDFVQLSNFSFIDCFVNTACPRITYDDMKSFPKPVVQAEEIL